MGFKWVSKSLAWHLEFYGFQPDQTKAYDLKSERYWRQGSKEMRLIWDPAHYVCRIEQRLSQQDEWRQIVEVPVQRVGWRWFSRMEWGSVSSKLLQPLNDYLAVDNADKVLFPLTVRWLDEDEAEILHSIHSVACQLEYFDSEELKSEATVNDRMGRPVRLLVKALDVNKCELE